jgi:hypothetical protein
LSQPNSDIEEPNRAIVVHERLLPSDVKSRTDNVFPNLDPPNSDATDPSRL